jgi:hypothetical protein
MDRKYAIVQSSGAYNFYWVSIVHTILPSFRVGVEEGEITLCYIVPLIIISTSPNRPRPQKTKKQKQKQTFPRADKKSLWVVELWSVTEVSEETGRGLNAGSILKSAAGGEIDNRIEGKAV